MDISSSVRGSHYNEATNRGLAYRGGLRKISSGLFHTVESHWVELWVMCHVRIVQSFCDYWAFFPSAFFTWCRIPKVNDLVLSNRWINRFWYPRNPKPHGPGHVFFLRGIPKLAPTWKPPFLVGMIVYVIYIYIFCNCICIYTVESILQKDNISSWMMMMIIIIIIFFIHVYDDLFILWFHMIAYNI